MDIQTKSKLLLDKKSDMWEYLFPHVDDPDRFYNEAPPEWFDALDEFIQQSRSKDMSHVKGLPTFLFKFAHVPGFKQLPVIALSLTRKVGKITIGLDVQKLFRITIDDEEDYPSIQDPNFQQKVTRYDDFNIPFVSHHPTTAKEVEQLSNKLCNSSIELSTYQLVIRNFLSNATPYNGLLLYHGLGTGKTCSAITIAEEHRKFLKQSGLSKKIYILGNKNIKLNFKNQLFKESHLRKRKGEWTCSSCIGNTILAEMNPSGAIATKEFLVKKIEATIKKYYKFMGYLEFASMVNKHKKEIVSLFENSMIVIDEVHNIKDDDAGATASKALDLITRMATTKLLLLSATPMFNQSSEIIWLMNLLRRNDKRDTMEESQLFKDGSLLDDETFVDYVRGYVSFVKGENPYTFPYRIYPPYFDERNVKLPTLSIHGEPFDAIQSKVYPVQMSDFQKEQYESIFNPESIGEEVNNLTMGNLVSLSGALNMTYPSEKGLAYMQLIDGRYQYYEKKERCFDPQHIKKYSAKIHSICTQVDNSEGTVLIYTNLVKEGLIPMALALESMGYHRHPTRKNFMAKPAPFKGTYCVLTGSSTISDEDSTLAMFNSNENKNGEKIKIILITKAASEGVDLKNVRQIHVMDPWWHLNRIEQVIGRGIRLCSHKALPFEKRNAQVFLYVSVHGNTETVDHYLYRYSENKAKKIGKISRLLKETSMDCVMNHPQLNTIESFGFTIPQRLSNGKQIDFPLGDESFTLSCDFMDCNYTCAYPADKPIYESEIYDVAKIMDKIKQMYKKGYIYTREELYTELNLRGKVSYRQLYEALTLMIDNKMTFTDGLSRVGYLINQSSRELDKETYYYVFQPSTLDTSISVPERRIPPNVAPPWIRMTPEPPVQEYSMTAILFSLNDKFKRAMLTERPPTKDSDWCDIVPEIMPVFKKYSLEKHRIKIDDSLIQQCVVDHIIEMLIYPECLHLVNHLFFSKELTAVEKMAKHYFTPFHKNGNTLLRVWNDTEIVILKQFETEWKEYGIQDTYEVPSRVAFGTVVGGVANKSTEVRVLKTKHMAEEHTVGQICEDALLNDSVVPRLNYILGGGYPYIPRSSACCLIELLLRYLQKINHLDKMWFLNALDVIYFNKDGVLKMLHTRKRNVTR